jgi:Hsp70 protein.
MTQASGMTISRAKFEALCADLFERMLEPAAVP